jgi:hypothetical protein
MASVMVAPSPSQSSGVYSVVSPKKGNRQRAAAAAAAAEPAAGSKKRARELVKKRKADQEAAAAVLSSEEEGDEAPSKKRARGSKGKEKEQQQQQQASASVSEVKQKKQKKQQQKEAAAEVIVPAVEQLEEIKKKQRRLHQNRRVRMNKVTKLYEGKSFVLKPKRVIRMLHKSSALSMERAELRGKMTFSAATKAKIHALFEAYFDRRAKVTSFVMDRDGIQTLTPALLKYTRQLERFSRPNAEELYLDWVKEDEERCALNNEKEHARKEQQRLQKNGA